MVTNNALLLLTRSLLVMIKLNKKTYRGIEYINLSSLSDNQSKSLSKSLSDRTLIKILQDDLVVSDCVLYSAYEDWYKSIVVEVEAKPIERQPEPAITKETVLTPA